MKSKSNLVKIVVAIILIVILGFILTKYLILGNSNKIKGSISDEGRTRLDSIRVGNYVKFKIKNKPTTIKNLIGSDIQVLDGSSEVSDTTNLKSGHKLKIDNNTQYTICVLADVIADGKLQTNDVSKTYNYVSGKTQLSDLQLVAADYNEDGSVTVNDVSKIYNELIKATTGSDHKVIIQIDLNGGSLASKHGEKYSTNGTLVTKNGSTIVQTIKYGQSQGTDGLPNYNNSGNLNIEKSGYFAQDGAEYINPDNNRKYNQDRSYNAGDFCNASNDDCTVTLKVNWVDTVKVKLNPNNGTLTTASGWTLENDVLAKTIKYNSTYGTLPTPTRDGYTFIGWFASDSTAKDAQDILYYKKPMYYYADKNPDLYNLVQYGEQRLYTHYIYHGLSEGREHSEYLSSTKMTKKKNHILAAGWMPNSKVVKYNLNGGTLSNVGVNTYTLDNNTYYGKYLNNTTYSTMPTVTKSGNTFTGWYDCSSKAKKDSSKLYKDNPLLYYADYYPDLYKTYAYDQGRLNVHYHNNGKSEGRRTGQFTSSDKISITKSEKADYCAGFIKTLTYSRASVCGNDTCARYNSCQSSACGTTSSPVYSTIRATESNCSANYKGTCTSYEYSSDWVRVDYSATMVTDCKYCPGAMENGGVKITRSCTYRSDNKKYNCIRTTYNWKSEKNGWCQCKYTSSYTTAYKSCETSACGCAQYNYKQCWHE